MLRNVKNTSWLLKTEIQTICIVCDFETTKIITINTQQTVFLVETRNKS